MTYSKTRISSWQLFALLFTARAVIMITVNATLVEGANMLDNVLSCALALVLNFVFVLPLYFLNRRYPKQNVLDTGKRLLGRFGWLVPLVYLLYFILLDGHYLSFFELFLANAMDPLTPLWLVAAAVLATAVYAASRGIEAVARAGSFVALLIVLGMLFILLALTPRIDPLNYEPFMYHGPRQTIAGTLLFLSRSTGFATMAILLPMAKGRRKLGFTVWNIAIYALMAATILVMVGALGGYLNSQLFPVYAASSYASAGVLEDLDAIFTGVWICGLFIKVAADLCLIAMCAARLWGAHKWSLPAAAVAIGVLSLCITESRALQSLFFGIPMLLCATLAAACLLPLLLLLLDTLKRRRGKND